jgi:hypothetical protein
VKEPDCTVIDSAVKVWSFTAVAPDSLAAEISSFALFKLPPWFAEISAIMFNLGMGIIGEFINKYYYGLLGCDGKLY